MLAAEARRTAETFSKERCADQALDFYGEILRATRRERLLNERSPWSLVLERFKVEWDLLAEKTQSIVDAVLAAAGLGDIGTHFGTDQPEYAGAHATAFLARTRALAGEAGWRIGNVSVQVQANRPRFAARRAEAERVLSEALGAPVAVSATTTDGLGFTGTGEGVAAFAVAVVVPA